MVLKLLLVYGTRPEAIKMAPVYHALKSQHNKIAVKVCVTGQHRQMLDMVNSFFDIQIDYDLNIMKANQSLSSISAEILLGIPKVFDDFRPDWVLVHGDTTTSTVAALAAFYAGVKVAHVEAGLRTNNKYSPFPEEMNRVLTARLADIHFAPTKKSYDNLVEEGVPAEKILVTGNTVIDALFLGLRRVDESSLKINSIKTKIIPKRKVILITAHRRENFGKGFENLCKAILELATLYKESIQIIYPVHLNPNAREPVLRILNDLDNVTLMDPLDYEAFIWLMSISYLIITDSGGVQEEAPSLGKPVLVMRETTERPEAVYAGTVKLVGTDYHRILKEASTILDSQEVYQEMASKNNPYGDGLASTRIVNFFNHIN